MFIVIEGIDAAGKHTQVERLRNDDSVILSFPRYETPLGRLILKWLKGEIPAFHESSLAFQCLMSTDKYGAVPEIQEAIDGGYTVVADRWWHSAYAYGGADGVDKRWLIDIHEALPQPDLAILIDLSPSEALRRRPEARDSYELDRAKQEVVRTNYHELWHWGQKHMDDTKWVVADGSQDVEAVAQEIQKSIRFVP